MWEWIGNDWSSLVLQASEGWIAKEHKMFETADNDWLTNFSLVFEMKIDILVTDTESLGTKTVNCPLQVEVQVDHSQSIKQQYRLTLRYSPNFTNNITTTSPNTNTTPSIDITYDTNSKTTKDSSNTSTNTNKNEKTNANANTNANLNTNPNMNSSTNANTKVTANANANVNGHTTNGNKKVPVKVYRSAIRETINECLEDIKSVLPAGLCIRSCWNCSWAYYSPYDFSHFGGLGCFKSLPEWNNRSNLDGIFDAWAKKDNDVQEVHSCSSWSTRTHNHNMPQKNEIKKTSFQYDF